MIFIHNKPLQLNTFKINRYFIISSIRDDIKIEKFDYLIEYYHSELVKNLETLKYPEAIPTLADIHIDMLEKGCFGEYF
jgi:hypothetical protein